jgi:molybdopterin-containing oxidoreductase family membrane subunit
MTYYNFKSIFAWNIILYTGFMAVVLVYLFTMMERKMNAYSKPVGIFAFVWRLILTTGTGSIFGFLVAREAYNSALLAPMFIVMSFVFGTAIYILVLMYTFRVDSRPLGDVVLFRLKNLLGVFIAGMLYFTLVYHITNLYITENHEFVAFVLRDGGIFTAAFWVGHMLVGGLIPLVIIYHPVLGQSRQWIAGACGMVILGGLANMYLIIIGGQAFPMSLFPGKTIIESGFYDGVNGLPAAYAPSIPEVLLGVGGVAVALLLTTVGIRMLRFLPASLADEVADPHGGKTAAAH